MWRGNEGSGCVRILKAQVRIERLVVLRSLSTSQRREKFICLVSTKTRGTDQRSESALDGLGLRGRIALVGSGQPVDAVERIRLLGMV